MTRQLFNLTIFLALVVELTSCNGAVKKDQPEKKAGELKAILVGQAKLIKTQGSLSGDNVHCSLQDKAGNLWFGTTGEGIYKFDGKSFKQFTATNGLNSNTVHYLLEDKDGNIWIGTSAGVCLYDGIKFTEFQIALPDNSLSNNFHVFSIMQDKTGKLWFATVDGVYIYDGKSFSPFIVNEGENGFMSNKNNVEYILEDKEGTLWFGGRGNTGVFRYDGTSITNLKPNEDNWAWPVLEDTQGNIWFSDWNGAYRYDGKSFTGFTKDDGLNGAVARIIEDSNGHIWFGREGENGGISRYDGKSFTHFTSKDGLINNGIWSILEDKAGNLWVGTRNTGLYRYDGKTFSSFSEKESLFLN